MVDVQILFTVAMILNFVYSNKRIREKKKVLSRRRVKFRRKRGVEEERKLREREIERESKNREGGCIKKNVIFKGRKRGKTLFKSCHL